MLALEKFPPPPLDRTGWPWTEAAPQPSNTAHADSVWPKISIVTPSYNQEQFLEETIRSVLLQQYPNLEYIIIDGASTDNSVRIIQKYEQWLKFWVSEPDDGQAHAINKGFEKCTGDLIGWLNSDDFLLPGALFAVANGYLQAPEAIQLGEVIHFSESGEFVQVVPQKDVTFQNMVDVWKLYTSAAGWSQQGTYVPLTLHKQVGRLDEQLRFVFDRDWMCRLTQIAPAHYLKVPVATFRKHIASKTVAETPEWLAEETLVTERYQYQSQSDRRLILAGLEMYGALMNLSITTHWNRKEGLAHLKRAFGYSWKIYLSKEALGLVVRAFFPLGLLRFSKKVLGQLRMQNLNSFTGVVPEKKQL